MPARLLYAAHTIANDVTAFSHRLVDLIGSRRPNMTAKTFDIFCPARPALVTAEDRGDPHAEVAIGAACCGLLGG